MSELKLDYENAYDGDLYAGETPWSHLDSRSRGRRTLFADRVEHQCKAHYEPIIAELKRKLDKSEGLHAESVRGLNELQEPGEITAEAIEEAKIEANELYRNCDSATKWHTLFAPAVAARVRPKPTLISDEPRGMVPVESPVQLPPVSEDEAEDLWDSKLTGVGFVSFGEHLALERAAIASMLNAARQVPDGAVSWSGRAYVAGAPDGLRLVNPDAADAPRAALKAAGLTATNPETSGRYVTMFTPDSVPDREAVRERMLVAGFSEAEIDAAGGS